MGDSNFINAYVLTFLFFDSKGSIASRNVGVTFSLHEAERHKARGVENEFETFQICSNWQDHADNNRTCFRHARVLRHGQRVAAGRGTAVKEIGKAAARRQSHPLDWQSK